MNEKLELRFDADAAKRLMPSLEGEDLGGVLRVFLDGADPRLPQVCAFQREARQRGGHFFTYWEYHRHYTPKELAAATCFELVAMSRCESSGAAHGTAFDKSIACPRCGVGRRQVSTLRFDQRKLKRSTDFLETLGAEYLVSDRMRATVEAAGLFGAEFRAIEHLETRRAIAGWHQMLLTAEPVDISAQTRCGISPCDPDERGQYRCSACGYLGLSVLSELYLDQAPPPGVDFAPTKQTVGSSMGLYVPHAIPIVSQRARQTLAAAKLKGFKFELVRSS